MSIRLEYAWGGNARPPVLVVYEDGRRVASFDSEEEARQWIADEYGPEAVETTEII